MREAVALGLMERLADGKLLLARRGAPPVLGRRRKSAASGAANLFALRRKQELAHDPEKLTDFSDKIMRQNGDFDVAHGST
jgi:hypothetical protein